MRVVCTILLAAFLAGCQSDPPPQPAATVVQPQNGQNPAVVVVQPQQQYQGNYWMNFWTGAIMYHMMFGGYGGWGGPTRYYSGSSSYHSNTTVINRTIINKTVTPPSAPRPSPPSSSPKPVTPKSSPSYTPRPSPSYTRPSSSGGFRGGGFSGGGRRGS